MDENKKKEIIKKLIAWANEIGNYEDFWKKNSDLGKTNIRSTATAILQASCFDEAILFLKYKKSREKTGWDKKIGDKGIFADVIIEKMKKIADECGKPKEKDCNNEKVEEWEKYALEFSARFLGYLYWKVYGIKDDKKNEKSEDKKDSKGKLKSKKIAK